MVIVISQGYAPAGTTTETSSTLLGGLVPIVAPVEIETSADANVSGSMKVLPA